MCGLFGYYCFGSERPDKRTVALGWKAQEARGRDASGIAYQDGGEEIGIEYYKRAVPVTALLNEIHDDHWAKILASPYAIAHARATTKGSAKNNENNHPVIAHNYVVTHNGVIGNDDDLFSHFEEKNKRNAEVDSEAINLVLAQGDSLPDAISQLSTLAGSVSFAAVPVRNPDTVILGRMNGSPFALAFDPVKKILYWASAVDGLYPTDGMMVGPLEFSVRKAMPDETVFLLEPDQITEFGVQGSPFFRPRPVSPALPSHYQSGGRSTGTSSYDSATGTWKPFEAAKRWEGGPVEITTAPLALVGHAWTAFENYHELGKPAPVWKIGGKDVATRWFPTVASVSAEIGKLFPTPYGAYKVCKDGPRFYTYKSTRKYWKKEAKDLLAQFPPPEAVAKKYENAVNFERVALELPRGARQYGWMCPWCGVMQTFQAFLNRKMKCEWCGITSKSDRPLIDAA